MGISSPGRQTPPSRFFAVTPVLSSFTLVLSGGWLPCPGAEILEAGVPAQEAFQRRACERLPGVAPHSSK
jgi:hypothetical protein